MSLRQLKFKPKLKPAPKNGENSSAKEIFTKGKLTDVANACVNNFPETDKTQEPCLEKAISKNVHIPINNITHNHENIPNSRILLPDSSLLPKDSSNSECNHSKETTLVSEKPSIIKSDHSLQESTKKINNDINTTTSIHFPLDLSPPKCFRIHQNPNLELSKTDSEFISLKTHSDAPAVIDTGSVSKVLLIHKENPNLNESTKNFRNEALIAEPDGIVVTQMGINICAKKVSRIRQKPNLQLSNKAKNGSGNVHIKSQQNTNEDVILNESGNEERNYLNEPMKTLSEDPMVSNSTTATHIGLDISTKKISRARHKPNFGLSKNAKDASESVDTSQPNEDSARKVCDNENKTGSLVTTKSSITKAETNLSKSPKQISDEAFTIETGRITPTDIDLNLDAKMVPPCHQKPIFGLSKKIKDAPETICNSADKLIKDVSVNESTNISDNTITLEMDAHAVTPVESTVFNVCAKKVSRVRRKPNFGISKKSKDVIENKLNNPQPEKADEDIVSNVSVNEIETNISDSSLVNINYSIIKARTNLSNVPEQIRDESLDLAAKISLIRQKPNIELSNKINDVSENIPNSDKKLIEDATNISFNESIENLCNNTITVETQDSDRITPTEPTIFNVCSKKVSRIRQKPNFRVSKKSKDVLENTFNQLQPKTDEDMVSTLSVHEEKPIFNESTKNVSDDNITIEKGRTNSADSTSFDLCSKKVSRIRQKPNLGLSKKGNDISGNTSNSSQQITDEEIVLKVPFNKKKTNLNEIMKKISDDPAGIETGETSSIPFDLGTKKVSHISKKPNLGSSKNDGSLVSRNAFISPQKIISEGIGSQASIKEEINNSNESERKLGENEITIESGRTYPVIGFDLSPKQIPQSHFQPNIELVINNDDGTTRNADEEIPFNVSTIEEKFNLSDSERNLSGDDDTIESGRTTPTHIGFDLSPKKIPRYQHRSTNDNSVVTESTLTKNYYEKKNIRKKNACKIVNHSLKLTSPQKGNFKPNLATLGKIKRPDKFTTSSYSKMESKAKQQLFKKFGKIEELDSSKLTMMDLIFYNPKSNPMSQSSDKQPALNEPKNTEKPQKETTVTEKNNTTNVDINKSDDILPVPQLKISADGKVIVAHESVVIQPSHNLENATFEDVIDGDFTKRKPMKNPNRCGWSHQDTIKFYKALNSLGCDFETMQSIFPDRSRRNLKSKFKKEEKLHGSLINKVLSRHSEFDLSNVVRELEIDTVYQNTIKNYGRELGTENGKRSKGRKKPISSIIAGKSPDKDDEESNDGPLIDGEFPIKKRTDKALLSKLSKALGLNDKNHSIVTEVENKSPKSFESNRSKLSSLTDSSIPAVGNKLSKSTVNDPLSNSKPNKRKRRKAVKYIESDSDDDYESQYIPNTKSLIIDRSNGTENESSQKSTRILRKRKPPTNKNFVLSLEDLINLGIENEAEKSTENHIVINTNIEFENVKYTRYISYNSNNLENPIEINETVAHVD